MSPQNLKNFASLKLNLSDSVYTFNNLSIMHFNFRSWHDNTLGSDFFSGVGCYKLFFTYLVRQIFFFKKQCKTKQSKRKQTTKQNKNKTKQKTKNKNKTKQTKTKQNKKTKQNTTKQNNTTHTHTHTQKPSKAPLTSDDASLIMLCRMNMICGHDYVRAVNVLASGCSCRFFALF